MKAEIERIVEIKSSKLVVVLGMHRSGTSAITRGLEVLGINLGDNLYPAETGNPKGFWEDNEFLAINEQLLTHFGSTSGQLGLMNWKVPRQSKIEPIRLRAENLVRKKSVKNSIWAFKDPRTARLLDFWQTVFECVGCDVHYIIAARNPISIVESLRKRNGYDPEKIFYLWLEYIVSAVLGTKGKKRIVVSYDRLLDNPELELSRVARSFKLPKPESLALAIYENEFLDAALRHTIFSVSDVKLYPDVPPQAITAFDWLERLAEDSIQSDMPLIDEAFDELRQELIALPAYWENSIADHRKAIKALTQIIELRDETVQAQDGVIAQRDETVQAQDEIIEQRDETIQAQTRLIDDGVADLRKLNRNNLVKVLRLVKLVK